MTPTDLRERIANLIYPQGAIERRGLERQLEIDPLTDLGNRFAFDKALPEAERDEMTAVVMFDVNNLGKVNKVIDHDEGDKHIRSAASTIREGLRTVGQPVRAFRIGGDEFAAFCSLGAAAELMRYVEQRFPVKSYGTFIVSIGGSFGRTKRLADSSLQANKARVKSEMRLKF